ncbi:hypothetical protein VP01_1265g1 [Puccinia sorghi]|uniref:Uncharacterized protein n=1 Tax=Puccinia sorghi TaxID=27349 RepID=A0A0L6VQL2_9BASI|nr:hypothetical protein VP01_1265g1 [Puccinia sorghi]
MWIWPEEFLLCNSLKWTTFAWKSNPTAAASLEEALVEHHLACGQSSSKQTLETQLILVSYLHVSWWQWVVHLTPGPINKHLMSYLFFILHLLFSIKFSLFLISKLNLTPSHLGWQPLKTFVYLIIKAQVKSENNLKSSVSHFYLSLYPDFISHLCLLFVIPRYYDSDHIPSILYEVCTPQNYHLCFFIIFPSLLMISASLSMFNLMDKFFDQFLNCIGLYNEHKNTLSSRPALSQSSLNETSSTGMLHACTCSVTKTPLRPSNKNCHHIPPSCKLKPHKLPFLYNLPQPEPWPSHCQKSGTQFNCMSPSMIFKCFPITFLNKLLVTSGMLLVVTCVDVKLNNQPDVLPKSSCYHGSNLNKTYVLSRNYHKSYQLWSPFYDLDILFFILMNKMRNLNNMKNNDQTEILTNWQQCVPPLDLGCNNKDGFERHEFNTVRGFTGCLGLLNFRTRAVSMALACKCFHITFSNNPLVTSPITFSNNPLFKLRIKLAVTSVDVKFKNQPDLLPKPSCYHPSNMNKPFHLPTKSYISFTYPIFIEIIFEFQTTVKDHKKNELWSPFYDLDILFYVMITLRIWIKALLVSLHQFLNPSPLGLLTKPTQLSQTITICAIHDINPLVGGGSLKHPSTTTHTRAWKANQISSASQSYFFPPWKMSPASTLPQACLQIFQGLCLVFAFLFSSMTEGKALFLNLASCHHNVPPYIMVKGRLTALRITPRAYSVLVEGLICFQHDINISFNKFTKELLLNCRGYQLNLGPSSPKIRLKDTIYNEHTTGISSVYVYDQVKKKVSAMETSLLITLVSTSTIHIGCSILSSHDTLSWLCQILSGGSQGSRNRTGIGLGIGTGQGKGTGHDELEQKYEKGCFSQEEFVTNSTQLEHVPNQAWHVQWGLAIGQANLRVVPRHLTHNINGGWIILDQELIQCLGNHGNKYYTLQHHTHFFLYLKSICFFPIISQHGLRKVGIFFLSHFFLVHLIWQCFYLWQNFRVFDRMDKNEIKVIEVLRWVSRAFKGSLESRLKCQLKELFCQKRWFHFKIKEIKKESLFFLGWVVVGVGFIFLFFWSSFLARIGKKLGLVRLAISVEDTKKTINFRSSRQWCFLLKPGNFGPGTTNKHKQYLNNIQQIQQHPHQSKIYQQSQRIPSLHLWYLQLQIQLKLVPPHKRIMTKDNKKITQ